jgi:ubiquinone/menaquinone biosynthesis C-methylase UbiE
VAHPEPENLLETAAGTGIVTRAVSEQLPETEVIATDVNAAVVEFAAQHVQSQLVTFLTADANGGRAATPV